AGKRSSLVDWESTAKLANVSAADGQLLSGEIAHALVEHQDIVLDADTPERLEGLDQRPVHQGGRSRVRPHSGQERFDEIDSGLDRQRLTRGDVARVAKELVFPARRA